MNSILSTPAWLLAQATANAATAAEKTEAALSPGMMTALYVVAGSLLIFVLPMLIARFLSKSLRMPKHETKFAVTIGVTVAAVLACVIGELRYGPDISGGTILLYQIDTAQTQAMNNASSGNEAGSEINAAAVSASLSTRLNPAGLSEISIRPFGASQVEIVVPKVDQIEIAEIKRLVTNSGILQFRIVANQRDHSLLLQAAELQSKSENRSLRLSREVKNTEGRVIGYWYSVGREPADANGIQPLREDIAGDFVRDANTGNLVDFRFNTLQGPLATERFLASQNVQRVDVLIALERNGTPIPQVNGEDLLTSAGSIDEQGRPCILFSLKSSRAKNMLALTSTNQPEAGFRRRMAIILDGEVLSAPALNGPISSNGTIEGRFTKQDVDFMVNMLRAGRLPAVLQKEPISENAIGSLLGVDTKNKGFSAALISLLVTFVMVLGYYRFPGFIACIGLTLNTLMIFAVMIAIHQPITLPGLAGLVLTVGMAVDANVLIFERIREEIAKGTNRRLAIRNGFDRAMTTIIDSNLTTLISAIVLYVVGTDQVRGFAVALTIGILCSMFTAVYVAHVLFDVLEMLGKIRLGMADLFGWIRKNLFNNQDIDFMGKRMLCYTTSLILCVASLAAVALRGREILDVDLAGGTSVVFQLDKGMDEQKVRDLIAKTFAEENGTPISTTLSAVETPLAESGSVYRLDTSLQNESAVKQRLMDGFKQNDGPQLVTFRIDAQFETAPAANQSGSTIVPARNSMRLVSFQPPAEQPPAQQPPAEQPPGGETPAAPAAEAPAPPAPQAPVETPATTPPVTTPPATTAPADATAVQPPPAVVPAAPPAVPNSRFTISFKPSAGKETARIEAANLKIKLIEAGKSAGVTLVDSQIELVPAEAPAGWTPDSTAGFDSWKVGLAADMEQSKQILTAMEQSISSEPVLLALSKVGPSVAGDMQQDAVWALVISLGCIAAYVWFRFQKLAFGLAAVVALFHDVIITLGVVAVTHWLVTPLGFLMVEDFKINLTMIAAFLTIIGYSLNDTIVVFDRIREVRGKSPKLTAEMINLSVNQTLSRTMLTSATTLATVFILYFLGGDGIHGFAFSLLIGIIVGTYSSIFIASPILIWLVGKAEQSSVKPPM